MGRGQQSFISRWDDQFVLANPDQSPPPLDRACICRLRLVQRPGKTNYWMASAAEALERREFEQPSAARASDWWAGGGTTGRIS